MVYIWLNYKLIIDRYILIRQLINKMGWFVHSSNRKSMDLRWWWKYRFLKVWSFLICSRKSMRFSPVLKDGVNLCSSWIALDLFGFCHFCRSRRWSLLSECLGSSAGSRTFASALGGRDLGPGGQRTLPVGCSDCQYCEELKISHTFETSGWLRKVGQKPIQLKHSNTGQWREKHNWFLVESQSQFGHQYLSNFATEFVEFLFSFALFLRVCSSFFAAF